ncbi:hypothetical protein BH09PSE2_BH09PSE2_22330 [soil metagenome]
MSATPAEAAPRRRPAAGGYARGEETRSRIVQAALEVFATDGFAAASTRRIAAQAGVTPPALQYHFDSKEGLHRACADLIIDHCSALLDPALEVGNAALTQGDADLAVEALCGILDVLADLSVLKDGTPIWSRFMTRAQGDDAAPAYARVKQAISVPMNRLGTALVAQATGGAPDSEEVRLRAILVLSQLTGLHHNRDQCLARLDWSDFGGDRLTRIKAMVRDHTRAMLLAARAGTAV